MDIKDVENLAELARIELSEEEKKGLLSDMQGILEYVKQIEGIIKIDVQPSGLNNECDSTNIWREDLPAVAGEANAREFSKELITEQFPDKQDGFLKVKKIL